MALISRLFMDIALYPPIEMRGAPVYMTEIIRSILCEHVQYITSVTCDYVRYPKFFLIYSIQQIFAKRAWDISINCEIPP